MNDLQTENKRLRDYIAALLKQHSDDLCAECVNEIKCEGEKCSKFTSGEGGTLSGVGYVDFPWTCEDFDYGSCAMMAGTPCDGCFDGGYRGFEWRGLR